MADIRDDRGSVDLWYEAVAACASVLAAVHLRPANGAVMDTWAGLVDQWPLSGARVSESTSMHEVGSWIDQLTGAALALLASCPHDPGEVYADQSRLYGIAGPAVCSPYESVYVGRDGLVFDEATMAVRAAYASLGLQAPQFNREPDDHLGLELDFCSHACALLVESTGAASEHVVSNVREFCEAHLLAWAPELVARAASAASTRWVKGIETLTLALLIHLAVGFDVTIDPARWRPLVESVLRDAR